MGFALNVLLFVVILLFYRYINIFILLCVMDGDFEVVFHHGAKFVNGGRLKYEGKTSTLSFDQDIWSYFLVVSVLKRL